MWKRRSKNSGDDAFWAWWTSARDGVVAELDARDPNGRSVRELLDQVQKLDLDCELGPGRSARHAVCLSCNGDPVRRKRAYRLAQGAPVNDEGVEFHPFRIAAADPTLIAVQIEGVRAALGDLRFDLEVDTEHSVVHVVIHTPDWPEQVRKTVGFLGLDAILGEEEVERWIGAVEWGESPTETSVSAAGLSQAVEDLRTSVSGNNSWRILQGRDRDGNVAVVVVRSYLKPIDHPMLDEVLECQIPVPVDPEGKAQLASIQDSEEELRQTFGSSVVHAASRTFQGIRTAYVYVDSDTPTGDEVEQWAQRAGFAVKRSLDPAWNATRPFR